MCENVRIERQWKFETDFNLDQYILFYFGAQLKLRIKLLCQYFSTPVAHFSQSESVTITLSPFKFNFFIFLYLSWCLKTSKDVLLKNLRIFQTRFFFNILRFAVGLNDINITSLKLVSKLQIKFVMHIHVAQVSQVAQLIIFLSLIG